MEPSPSSSKRIPAPTRLQLIVIALAAIACILLLSFAYFSQPSPANFPPQGISLISSTDAIDKANAWGTGLNIAKIPAAIDNNHVFVLETTSPDGKYLLGTIYPKALNTTPGKLVLIDFQTQQITNIHKLSQSTTQVRKADIDDGWIAWMEALYTDPETYGWDIFAYNRKTGESKKLAGEATPEVCSGCGTETNLLAVTHGLLFWEQISYGSRPPSTHITFNSTDLNTGVTTQIPGIENPSITSWPYIAWLEPTGQMSNDLSLDGLQHPVHTVVLHLRNIETGETRSLSTPENERPLALFDDTITWVSSRGEIYTTDLNKAQPKTLLNPGNMAALQMNNRLILLFDTSVETSGLFAWDLKLQRLVQLAKVPQKPITILVKNSIVIWTIGTATNRDEPTFPITGFPSSPDQIIYILNTASLPLITP